MTGNHCFPPVRLLLALPSVSASAAGLMPVVLVLLCSGNPGLAATATRVAPAPNSRDLAEIGAADDIYLPPTEAESWREVQEAIREGEKLRVRDAEPYFSRAEIWSRRLENQQEALLDTLRGVDVLLQADEAQSTLDTKEALEKLRSAAWRSLERPKSIYPGAAEQHFSAGQHAFWRKEYEMAASHFTRAIQLDTARPQYFYFRALSRRALGDAHAAAVDAEKGASAESAISHTAREDVSRSLRRVQGVSRVWLEAYRRGRPTYDPHRDATLPSRLAPDGLTATESDRIEHGMAVGPRSPRSKITSPAGIRNPPP